MIFTLGINATSDGRRDTETRPKRLQFNFNNKLGYGLSGSPIHPLFVIKKRIILFDIVQGCTLNVGILSHIATCDKNVLGFKNTGRAT